MKKFLATILALVMVLSLVACGGDSGTSESKEAAENTPVATKGVEAVTFDGNKTGLNTDIKIGIVLVGDETEGYTAADHLEALLRHGQEGLIDLCLANNAPIPQELAARYSAEDAELLRVDRERIARMGVALAEYPLLSAQGGYARHDPALLAQAVLSLYRERTVRIYRGTQQYITEKQENIHHAQQ